MGITETVMANFMSFERKEGRDHSETNSSSNGSDKVYIERSTNFKNWVSTEPKIEASDSIFESPDLTSSICRNGEVVQINKPTISFLGSNAAATKIQKVYRTYRTTRTNAAATRIQKVYKSYRTRRNFADCAVVDHSETNSSSNGSDKIYIERSTNFKNRVATEPKIEASDSIFESPYLTSPICRNGEVVQINKPTISFLEHNAAATKIQKVYRTYRTRRTNAAATRIQKVYKSYRTRRTFADCAVVVEELWLKALDLGARKRSSEALDIEKHETTESLRARTRARASGQADKLEQQHSLESVDPRHRYGHNLEFYYDVWCDCDSKQPFFYWLDTGDGKNINLSKCPRTDLQRQCISNLGQPQHSKYLVPTISAEWTFLVIGLCLEILSIAFDQAASPSKPRYALFGMTLSIAVLLICIWELIYKGKNEGVVLRRWGKLWWFYYPHSAQTFGTLPDFYGLIGSTSQCICSTVQYVCFSHHADNLIKVSLWPAIFLVCLGAQKLVEKRNETHGHND